MTKEEINGYSYRVTQASRTELLVIMYDVTLNYISDSISYFENENVERFREDIKKAQRVINQLTSALDQTYEISLELMRLYIYMNNVLVRSSIRKEVEELKVVVGMIQKLRSAFEKVSEQDKSGPIMINTQQVYAGLTYSNDGLNEYHDQTTKRGFTV
ncbi:flagellar export chaperone FliS [[Clostridium] fimetarium]|uniref:Flagellar protein FliS n=1 Tax=[Clostridium] fimetarium TaxID=99656 RepID=A0A1I0QSE8_9FIRM|nr:flagellar export chaperone FliS [[Clostridium] fimetarium]SEW30309.1 flagellar protein FliS [[Clostridium] fimetarium]